MTQTPTTFYELRDWENYLVSLQITEDFQNKFSVEIEDFNPIFESVYDDEGYYDSLDDFTVTINGEEVSCDKLYENLQMTSDDDYDWEDDRFEFLRNLDIPRHFVYVTSCNFKLITVRE